MPSPVRLAAWGLSLLASPVAGAVLPGYFQRASAPFTRRGLSVLTVQKELGAVISAGASIFGPADARYAQATERYSTHAVPDIEVVVVPGTESDVAITVRCIRGIYASGMPYH